MRTHPTTTSSDASGKLFYFVRAGDRDVFTAAFDAASGRLQSQPISATQRPGEEYRLPSWSPDGRHIAYLTREPWRGIRFNTITVRSIEGDEVRELQPGVANLTSFVWLPNGQTMMVNGTDERGRPTMFRFDLKTSTTRPEVTDTPAVVATIAFSKDSRFMYYARLAPRSDSTTPSRLLERDLNTGRERQILVAPAGSRMIGVFSLTDEGRTALVQTAPTGRRFAAGPRGLWAVSTETGAIRNLGAGIPLDSATEIMRPIGPTADGKGMLNVVGKMNQPGWSQLWRVPLAGGPATRLPDPPNIRRGMQAPGSWISPDGRRIFVLVGNSVHRALDARRPAPVRRKCTVRSGANRRGRPALMDQIAASGLRESPVTWGKSPITSELGLCARALLVSGRGCSRGHGRFAALHGF